MIATGKLLSVSSMSTTAEEQPKKETRMFKVGENSELLRFLPQADACNTNTYCHFLL